MRRLDDRGLAARGRVAAALELDVPSWLRRRRSREEAEERSHFFLLRCLWKDGQRRDFPGEAAERHGLVLVRGSMVFGVLHLDGTTAHDITHLCGASFYGSQGDVPAELRGHRVQLRKSASP